MIVECAACGDPLLPYMQRCSGCGAVNPGYTSSEPPRNSVYTTDEGTEWGLLGLGIAGLLAGASLVVSTAVDKPVWAPLLAPVCAVLGVAALIAFRRVFVSDLGSSAKTALRIVMVAVSMLFGWVFAITR